MAGAHVPIPGHLAGELPSHQAPSAARIAAILRSRDPWPQSDGGSAVDLAQRIVSQQRQMVDHGSAPSGSGHNSFILKSMDNSQGLAGGIPMGAIGGSVDMKVSQLAERVSLLLAGVQQQSSREKQELEHDLGSFSSIVETRLASLEGRMAVVEEHSRGRGRDHIHFRDEEALSGESAARTMREVRALVSGAVAEVQVQWRAQHSELMDGHQEQARQLEELSEHTKRGASRMQEAQIAFEGLQQGLDMQADSIQRSESELRTLISRGGGGAPPWYGELESSVARLEHRIDEQRSATEHQIGRFRVDAEGVRLRLEGLREDALCAVDRRIDQEIDRLMSQRMTPFTDHHSHNRGDKDLQRRLDESEARVAALRVRVDAHDDRFGALGERAEAACQQALESTRQAAGQHREEILQEVDCQLSILRQRMEAVAELCEELSVRHSYQPGGPLRWHESSGGPRWQDDQPF